MKIEEIENGIKVTILEKENYTLEDLKQNLINELNTQVNNKGNLNVLNKEIKLLKTLVRRDVST